MKWIKTRQLFIALYFKVSDFSYGIKNMILIILLIPHNKDIIKDILTNSKFSCWSLGFELFSVNLPHIQTSLMPLTQGAQCEVLLILFSYVNHDLVKSCLWWFMCTWSLSKPLNTFQYGCVDKLTSCTDL